MNTAAVKSKDACSLEKLWPNLDSILKSREIALLTKVCLVKVKRKWSRSVVSDSVIPWTVAYQAPPSMGFSRQSFGFASGHVWMWELDCKESWASKNWCFWTVVLEKTLESLLDCKEIQPVRPKRNQYWIDIGKTDAEAETPILWPSDVKNWLIRKDPDAGNDWRREEKGTTEDEMVGWMNWLNEHEFEYALGVWVSSGSWWWTGKPGILQSMGSQGVRHDWATELNWFHYKGFPGGSDSKESAYNVEDLVSILEFERSPGEGNDNLLQYFCKETSMDRGAWWAIGYGVTKSWTPLSYLCFHFIMVR